MKVAKEAQICLCVYSNAKEKKQAKQTSCVHRSLGNYISVAEMKALDLFFLIYFLKYTA